MQIRQSKDDDVSYLPELEQRAGAIFRSVGLDDVADSDPIPIETFFEIHANGLIWIAAEEDGPPAGFLAAKILDGCAYIHEVSVDPAHQGKKIGNRLIQTFCAWAKGRGYPLVTLSTFRSVPWNGPYYAKLGFEEIEGSALGPNHVAVRQGEIDSGLDAAERIFMQRKP